jgi:hypothetical protein
MVAYIRPTGLSKCGRQSLSHTNKNINKLCSNLTWWWLFASSFLVLARAVKANNNNDCQQQNNTRQQQQPLHKPGSMPLSGVPASKPGEPSGLPSAVLL